MKMKENLKKLKGKHAKQVAGFASKKLLSSKSKIRKSRVVKSKQVAHSSAKRMSQKMLKKILFEWNQTEADYPKDKTITQLFEEQVKKTPNKVAIVFEEQELTY